MSSQEDSSVLRIQELAKKCLGDDVVREAVALSWESARIDDKLFLGYAHSFFEQLSQTNGELYMLLYKLASVCLLQHNIKAYAEFLQVLKHDEFFLANEDIEYVRGILNGVQN